MQATKAEPPSQPVNTAADRDAPLSISASELAREVSKRPPATRYWIGFLPDAPKDHDDFCGFSIVKYEGKIELDDRTGAISNRPALNLGSIIEMTDAQRDLVLSRIKDRVYRVVREDGGSPVLSDEPVKARIARCDKLSRSSLDYYEDRRDEPAARFIYIQPVRELMPTTFRKVAPPPLLTN